MNLALSVYPPGTIIKLGERFTQTGRIVSVLLNEGGTVEYRCLWWEDTERKIEWLYEHEFTTEIPLQVIHTL